MLASRLIGIPAAILLFVVLTAVAVLIWRHVKSQRSPNMALFLEGLIPLQLPNGNYKGTVNGYDGTWIGKTFEAAHARGKNLFKGPGGVEQRYPFRTEVGRGLADPIPVIKIDYDIPGNPYWLRRILDEIVEVAPNQFLGKIHFRLGPMHAAVGYFELRK